jgi:Tfp pilus assembly protein PilZ
VQPERRANPRFACDLAAEIVVGDATSSRRVIDVSRGGISLVGDDPVAIGTHLTIKLQASNEDGDTEALDITGRIVWCTPTKDGTYQLGIKFDEGGPKRARRLEHLLEMLTPR